MVTPKQAEKMLSKWIQALRLQAWEVSCVWVEADRLDSGETDLIEWATVAADPARWQATLTVALKRSSEDVEQTILHECLHLLLAEWTGTVATARSYVPAALYALVEQQRYDAEERAVELLERALWRLSTAT